jgi:hypothetical protein
MIDRIARLALVSLEVALAWSPSFADRSAGRSGGDTPCARSAIGTDSFRSRERDAVFLGKSAGQSFVASDTLLRSIVVWHEPSNGLERVTLRILRTTPAGVPNGVLRSRSDWIDLESPALRFEFDPPLVLPSRGAYAFVLQTCGASLGLRYGFGDDLYPGGRFFYSGRSGCGPYLDETRELQWIDADLIFRIEFCDGAAAAVQDAPWGGAKERLR